MELDRSHRYVEFFIEQFHENETSRSRLDTTVNRTQGSGATLVSVYKLT